MKEESQIPADKMNTFAGLCGDETIYGYYYFTEDVQKKFQAYIDEE